MICVISFTVTDIKKSLFRLSFLREQKSVFSCVLTSVYITDAASHKARELHLIYSATLIKDFFPFFFYLTSVFCPWLNLLPKSSWKSQANLKFQINLSLQPVETVCKNCFNPVSDPHRDCSQFYYEYLRLRNLCCAKGDIRAAVPEALSISCSATPVSQQYFYQRQQGQRQANTERSWKWLSLLKDSSQQ